LNFGDYLTHYAVIFGLDLLNL